MPADLTLRARQKARGKELRETVVPSWPAEDSYGNPGRDDIRLNLPKSYPNGQDLPVVDEELPGWTRLKL